MSTPTPRLQRSVLAATLAGGVAFCLLLAAPDAPPLAGVVRADAQPLSRPTPTRVPGSCDATGTRRVDPNPVVAGDVATMTLFLGLDCAPDSPFPVHIVFAVDDTVAMATQAGRDALRALRGWVTSLPTYPKESTLRVSVVGYRAPRPLVRCPLNGRLDVARRCIDRLTGDGEGGVADGIAAALDVLEAGRPAGVDRDSIREVVVVVSGDGGDTVRAREGDACVRALAAAGTAKGQGILLIFLAVGAHDSRGCSAAVATSPRYRFVLPGQPSSLARLREIVASISRYDIDRWFWSKRHSILETLPTGTTFVDGRFDPAPDSLTERQAGWAMSFVPRSGMTITYQIRAAEIGVIDVPEQSLYEFDDDRHQRQAFMPAPALLHVLSPYIDPLP